MLLITWMGAVSADEVTIGNEEGTSYQLPVNMYYNYSLTQQIYTAEEIGTPGFINSISFNYAHTQSFSKTDVRVYLKEVEKSAFDSNTDMVPVSDADLYFEGTFSATGAGWVTINLDKLFEYSGTQNLLVCFYDPTQTYQGSQYIFRCSNTTDNTSLTYYADGIRPNIDDLQSYSGSKSLKKIRSNIKLEFSSGSIERTLTVCDGTETNQYVPLYGNYADWYQKCEFIIPANKLNEMEDKALSKMTFYLSSPAQESWGSAKFKVFLKEVDNTTITDYYGTTGATVVYEGSLDGTKNTMDIAFTTPYTYQGGNLLVGVYQTVKGTDNSATFIGTYAQNASIQGMNSSSLDNASINRYNFIPKTTFSYIHTISSYPKPTNLTVTDIGFYGATVSWTSDANKWDLRYKSSYDESWTKVYGLTSKTYSFDDGLSGTRYEVQVRSNDGSGNVSDWASTSFVTTICDENNRAAISYELTDSYGDGWNGNAINIVHSNTGLVVATLDMTTKDGKMKKGTIDLCLGEDYDFVWVEGTYGKECGFTIKDNFGEDILVHEAGEAPDAGLMTTYGVTWWDPAGKRPTNLAVAEGPGPDRVTLTWTPGTESQTTWDFDYVKVGEDTHCGVDNVQTGPPYEFTGLDRYPLEPNTTYKVKVRSSASDAGGVSRWSNIISFTTSEENPIPSQLKVEATYNSATISWVGYSYYYNVKYRKEGETTWNITRSFEKTFTIYNLTPNTEYEYQIVGVAYPNTENAGTTVATFTTPSFTAPQNMTVSDIAPTAATVSWLSDATVDLQYAQLPADCNIGGWMHYDYDEESTSSIGCGSGNSFSWAVMFPAGTYGNGALREVSIYDCEEMTGTISIYNIETKPSDDDTPIATKNIELTGDKDFVNFSFNVPLDVSKNVWVVINNESGASYPAATSEGYSSNGQWVSLGTDWMLLGEANSSLSDRVFRVRALIGDDIDPSTLTWANVANSASPKKLTNLSTNTPYIVRVKAKDGQYESDWVTKSFITLPDNPVPFDLTAEAETNTATISWMGYSTKYNVRYRTAATTGALFFDDFENGMNKWTVIRNGEEGNEDTDWHTCYLNGSYKAHSGSYAAITRSWSSYNAYNVDNWLITPKVTLDGTLKFWVFDDGSYHEHYDVYVSTTTNDISAFTLIYSPGDASGMWTEVTVDLSSFHGQKGYIALRNQDYDKDFLLVDDFGIYGEPIPEGNWSSFNVQGAKSIVLVGLNPSTTYEYQVQGVKGSATSEWSPIAKFTTLEAGITTGLEAIDNGQLTIDNANDGWFTIDGQKLSGKPTKKGIYIHNGRKTVLK